MQLFGIDLFDGCGKRILLFHNELKRKVDSGEISFISLAVALSDGFSCYSVRGCGDCHLRLLKDVVGIHDVSCSDACGGIVRVLYETGILPHPRNCQTRNCKSCANYTKAGCKEHIDWYPEENDYCSKYKEIQND